MTVNVQDDPSMMDLPFHGKRRLVSRGPWVPCVFWFVGGHVRDATYYAWINGDTYEVPDPLQTPYWPWHSCTDDEWWELYETWERGNATVQ